MKIVCVIGTRPEAIKMAPVIQELRKHGKSEFNVCVLATAQHREMLDQVLNFFNIKPDIDLNIMQQQQELPQLTSRLLISINEVFLRERPDLVLVQGDTTTVMVASLVAFYNKIRVGHIEAGLRTGNNYSPFPEEINRMITSVLASLHFAPTKKAEENLLLENVPKNNIFITGNTVIDALYSLPIIKTSSAIKIDHNKKTILVTIHRRENFGARLSEILSAIKSVAEKNNDIQIVFPVHPNPNIKENVDKILKNNKNIIIVPPLSYGDFVSIMRASYFVITDSGGLQEEAPALGKPVLVLRDNTERDELLSSGSVILVGSCSKKIIASAERLINDNEYYKKLAVKSLVYGDGNAAKRIVECIRNL